MSGKMPAWFERECGGRVGRADGGKAPQWSGEGDSGKDKKVEAQELRDTAKNKLRGAAALVSGGLTGAILGRKSIKGAASGIGALGTGIVLAKDSGDDKNRAAALNAEADKAEGRASGGKVNKGPLDAKRRNALPEKSFAGLGRSYPISDPNHARNALSRVSNKSPALKARVRAAVHRKYPSIGKD